MSQDSYRTIAQSSCEELVINKSRFLGQAAPCATEEEALRFLQQKRQQYRDATHNCYAYTIGSNMGVMRYSDDGEPGGTAGMPIIEVMKARGVTNCAVVVTRYFGGILLGAGGLVRAYSQGAAAALRASGVGTMHPTARYLMEIGYPLINRMDFFLKDEPVMVEDKAFTDVVTYTLVVRCADEAGFLSRLANMSDGVVEPLRYEELYLPWPEEETP